MSTKGRTTIDCAVTGEAAKYRRHANQPPMERIAIDARTIVSVRPTRRTATLGSNTAVPAMDTAGGTGAGGGGPASPGGAGIAGATGATNRYPLRGTVAI